MFLNEASTYLCNKAIDLLARGPDLESQARTAVVGDSLFVCSDTLDHAVPCILRPKVEFYQALSVSV